MMKCISFDASYTDQTLELLAFSEEISNQPTITEFTKVDLTGGQEIEGAQMQILDQEGKVVEEWVSKKEAHVVYALAPGEYILHEEQAPTEQGYVRAEDVKFVVEETGEVQKVKMRTTIQRFLSLKQILQMVRRLKGLSCRSWIRKGKL